MAVIYKKKRSKPLTAREITWHLVKRHSLFDFRTNFVCISNLSWGFLYWEADLFIVNKSGYAQEIEIKLSKSDWLNDKKKAKFVHLDRKSIKTSWNFIKQFWYAAPIELAKQYESFGVKRRFGVLGVHEDGHVEVVKQAIIRKNYTKLNPEQMLYIARLASMRAWKTYQREFRPKKKRISLK